MRTIALAVALLSAVFMQEVSGSFLKATPEKKKEAVKEHAEPKLHLAEQKKEKTEVKKDDVFEDDEADEDDDEAKEDNEDDENEADDDNDAEAADEKDERDSKPRLQYVPVKYLNGCPSISPDFGPHPHAGPLKGFWAHLQVAMEVSCTDAFMRCAYVSKDFDLLAEGIAGGILADASLKADQETLKQGIASGARAVHERGINARLDQQDIPDFAKCSTLPGRSTQLSNLRTAIQTHFKAQGATPANFQAYPGLAEGVATGFCDQIGDTGESACNDLMTEAIHSHYNPRK